MDDKSLNFNQMAALMQNKEGPMQCKLMRLSEAVACLKTGNNSLSKKDPKQKTLQTFFY